MPKDESSVSVAAGGVLLRLHVHPGAKRDGLAGTFGSALKVELKTPPVEGRANAALLKYLAKSLGVPRSALTIRSGECSRDKVIFAAGCTAETIEKWISANE